MPHIALNGVRLHYASAGAGRPAFVFVHGGGCALGDWSQQLAVLGRDFMALAMDLRGHGGSGGETSDLHISQWADDVNGLIDALALGPVVLTGHSLGSRIVAEAAWRRPDNVAALVLLDGSRMVGGLAAVAATDAPPQGMSIAAIIDRTVGPHADPAVRGHVSETMSSTPDPVLEAAARALQDWDVTRADAVFAGLAPALPVLAIQSTYHDRLTPRRSLRRDDETTPYLDFLRSVRPDMSIEVLVETGHFSMLERSEAVTALIRNFGVVAWEAAVARRAAHTR